MKCKKKNHFASACRSKQAAEVTSYSETPPADHSHAAAEAVNKNYFCGSVVNVEDDKPAWYVTLDVEGNPVKFKVDSGADVTVVSEAAYKRLQPKSRLSPNTSPLTALEVVCLSLENSSHAHNTEKQIIASKSWSSKKEQKPAKQRSLRQNGSHPAHRSCQL